MVSSSYLKVILGELALNGARSGSASIENLFAETINTHSPLSTTMTLLHHWNHTLSVARKWELRERTGALMRSNLARLCCFSCQCRIPRMIRTQTTSAAPTASIDVAPLPASYTTAVRVNTAKETNTVLPKQSRNRRPKQSRIRRPTNITSRTPKSVKFAKVANIPVLF